METPFLERLPWNPQHTPASIFQQEYTLSREFELWSGVRRCFSDDYLFQASNNPLIPLPNSIDGNLSCIIVECPLADYSMACYYNRYLCYFKDMLGNSDRKILQAKVKPSLAAETTGLFTPPASNRSLG